MFPRSLVLTSLFLVSCVDPGSMDPDEASLVERLDQIEVSVVQGTDRNIKITKPSDMDLARLFLSEETARRNAS